MGFLLDIGLAVPQIRRLYDSRNALAERLAQTEEKWAALSAASSPFSHYNSQFDAIDTMQRHAVANLTPTEGYLTNFLGVRIPPKVFPTILDDRAGQVEAIPIPANWHADIAEWAAALRAVDLARDSFTMIELGCGWGCWMNNSGVAARNAGLKVHLIGVEGDEGHVAFAQETFTANGFSADQIDLRRGVAAAGSGFALFPRQAHAGGSWGLEPVFGASETQRRQAALAGSHDELPMIPMADLVQDHARIDLLHIDIQGGEADLIEACAPLLREKVGFLLIGTHSREIEGRLFTALRRDGWVLEIERPAIFMLTKEAPVVTVDGVQGWRNPALIDV